MHRTRRAARSIDSVGVIRGAQAPRPFLCHVCRYQATSSFSTAPVQRAPETGKVPLSERVRRRLWGTDQPPGQEDPYGGPSILDQVKAQNKAKAAEERGERRPVASTTISEDYEPATTWDGLESVGGVGHWWKSNWDPKHPFVGFTPAQIVADPEEITAALRRALVEAFALKQAGEPLDKISKAEPAEDLTHDVQVVTSDSGSSLIFSENATLEDIVQSLAPQVEEEAIEENPATESEQDIAADRSTEDVLHPETTQENVEPATHEPQPTESEEDVAADRSAEDPLESQEAGVNYAELVASWDPSWLQTSIVDPEIKFAVIKRTLQLTGIRVSDTAIRSITTANSLLSQLVTPPKPRKLVEALEQREEFVDLPNVKVHAKRITAIDKEKTVGRWKIIEKELENRGLPLTGYTRPR